MRTGKQKHKGKRREQDKRTWDDTLSKILRKKKRLRLGQKKLVQNRKTRT